MREQLILTGNPEDMHTQMANYASDTSSFSRTDAPSQASAAVFLWSHQAKIYLILIPTEENGGFRFLWHLQNILDFI